MPKVTLDFRPNDLVVEILDGGQISFDDLYAEIRGWEASNQGITFKNVVDSNGNVELPDGTKTPKVMILVNGWRLSAQQQVSIFGGLIAGKDKDGKPRNPIVNEAKSLIQVLSPAAPGVREPSSEPNTGVNIQVPTDSIGISVHAPEIHADPNLTQNTDTANADTGINVEAATASLSLTTYPADVRVTRGTSTMETLRQQSVQRFPLANVDSRRLQDRR